MVILFLLVCKSQIRIYLIPQSKSAHFWGVQFRKPQIRKFPWVPVPNAQIRKFAKKKAVLRKYIVDYKMSCLKTIPKAKSFKRAKNRWVRKSQKIQYGPQTENPQIATFSEAPQY